jgi:hypothetical protein
VTIALPKHRHVQSRRSYEYVPVLVFGWAKFFEILLTPPISKFENNHHDDASINMLFVISFCRRVPGLATSLHEVAAGSIYPSQTEEQRKDR